MRWTLRISLSLAYRDTRSPDVVDALAEEVQGSEQPP